MPGTVLVLRLGPFHCPSINGPRKHSSAVSFQDINCFYEDLKLRVVALPPTPQRLGREGKETEERTVHPHRPAQTGCRTQGSCPLHGSASTLGPQDPGHLSVQQSTRPPRPHRSCSQARLMCRQKMQTAAARPSVQSHSQQGASSDSFFHPRNSAPLRSCQVVPTVPAWEHSQEAAPEHHGRKRQEAGKRGPQGKAGPPCISLLHSWPFGQRLGLTEMGQIRDAKADDVLCKMSREGEGHHWLGLRFPDA